MSALFVKTGNSAHGKTQTSITVLVNTFKGMAKGFIPAVVSSLFFINAGIADTLPRNGFALKFDGEGDSVDLPIRPHDIDEEGITFSCRIKIAAGAGGDRMKIFSGFNYGDNRWDFEYNQAGVRQLEFNEWGGTRANPGNQTLKESTWYFVSFVWEPEKKVTIYIDGEKDAEFYIENSTLDDGQNFRIAGRPDGAEKEWEGQIRDVSLWRRPLTHDEIRNLADTPLTGDEEGLVGYWPFNEGEGELVKDRTGTNHGRLSGTVEWTLFEPFKAELPAEKQVEPGQSVTFGPVKLEQPQGEVSYQWYFENEPIEEAKGSSLKILDADFDDLGIYSVKVEDRRGITVQTDSYLTDRGFFTFNIENPYEDVEWETTTLHKINIHEHYRGYGSEPADVLDVLMDGAELDGKSLSEDEYFTILGVASQAEAEPPYWGTDEGGWTDMADLHEEFDENRDPTELGVEGVLSFPVQEIDDVEHFIYLFSSASPQDFDYYPGPNPGGIDDFIEAVREALDEDRGLVKDEISTQVVIAHGSRYWSDIEDAKTRYNPLFDEYTHEDGLLGLEIFGKFLNQQGNHYGDGFSLYDYFEVWDDLNKRYMPERPVWGFAAGDANHGRWGSGSGPDLQFMYMPLSDDDFDPNNWYQKMEVIHEYFKTGRFFSAMRNPGDWDSPENAPGIPRIESITVDYDKPSITIDIDWPDEEGNIDWYSSQGLVGFGSTININSQYVPFVRAYAYTSDGHIITQPFGIEKEKIEAVKKAPEQPEPLASAGDTAQ